MRLFVQVLSLFLTTIFSTSSLHADEALNRALFQAVKIGHVDRVAYLLERGANAGAQDISGKTPLMYAVERSGIDIITVLDRGLQNTQFAQARKATLWQTSAVYDRIAKMLLESKPKTITPSQEPSAHNLDESLLAAVIAGDTNRVRSLLAEGANPNATGRGRSALIWAAFWNHPEVAQLLLGSGANLSQRDANGFTALMWANERGYTQLAELLQRQSG